MTMTSHSHLIAIKRCEKKVKNKRPAKNVEQASLGIPFRLHARMTTAARPQNDSASARHRELRKTLCPAWR